MFVRVRDGLSVRKDEVTSIELLSRHYINGSHHSLKITLRDGAAYIVDHNPEYIGGVDVFKLKKELES
jgi:hypothetical protein